ncbi:MAG: flagellar biosynthesis anti-sigma factor FlgM [Nitrospinota bacterium]
MKVFGSNSNSNRVANSGESKSKEVKNQNSEESGSRRLSSEAKAGNSENVVLTAPKEMEKVRAVIAKTPDVRTQKVEELKEKIEQGEYHVPGSKIAGKMLIEMLEN